MVGRHLLSKPGQDLTTQLGEKGEDVLPNLVNYLHTQELIPALLVGVFIAIVLSAIMSTIDSLLVVASSAAVLRLYQKVRHPDLSDESLVGLSRTVTIGLAIIALIIALGVAFLTPERSVFWFVIFGWSGIPATFCPVVILSLFWSRMTGRGALAAMITGFVSVPLFKFGATALPGVGPILARFLSCRPRSYCL